MYISNIITLTERIISRKKLLLSVDALTVHVLLWKLHSLHHRNSKEWIRETENINKRWLFKGDNQTINQSLFNLWLLLSYFKIDPIKQEDWDVNYWQCLPLRNQSKVTCYFQKMLYAQLPCCRVTVQAPDQNNTQGLKTNWECAAFVKTSENG